MLEGLTWCRESLRFQLLGAAVAISQPRINYVRCPVAGAVANNYGLSAAESLRSQLLANILVHLHQFPRVSDVLSDVVD